MKLRIRVKRPEPKKRRDAFDLWNHDFQMADGSDDFIAHPGGNPKAKILVLTPVPDNYKTALLFAETHAALFRTMLREEIGLNLEDCLIVPCVRYGAKALKANTRDVMEWVQRCVQRKMFKLVICIGSDSAKWIINGGKKANIAGLAGQIMYPKEINHTPLFLFPDVKGLVWEPHPTNPRENYWREQAANGHMRRLTGIAHQLSEILRSLFPQGKNV